MNCIKHNLCSHLNDKVDGVAVIILNNYYGKEPVVLLGRERFGIYKHKYNFCAGKREPKDNGCLYTSMAREMAEEFKIKFSKEHFNKVFKDSNGNLRWFLKEQTLIFVGMAIGLTSKPLKKKILEDIANPNLPFAQKEMSDIGWFKISDQTSIDNDPNKQVSNFVRQALDRAWQFYQDKP